MLKNIKKIVFRILDELAKFFSTPDFSDDSIESIRARWFLLILYIIGIVFFLITGYEEKVSTFFF